MSLDTLQDQLRAFAEKLREPLLPTHLTNWLLSVVLLGCASNSRADLGEGKSECGFHKDEGTCSSTVQFAVVAFLASTLCVVVEARWERLANYHRNIYLAELVVSAVFSLVFFGYFVKLASAWGATDSTTKSLVGSGNPGGAIAAALLSILSWGVLAWLSYKGYKEDDLGGIERLTTYVDPVTSGYHGGGSAALQADEGEPPVP